MKHEIGNLQEENKHITRNMAEINLRANHLICIVRWAVTAASTVSNRK